MGILKWYKRDQIASSPIWVDADALSRPLIDQGWKTPDTYDNFFAPLGNEPAIYLLMAHDIDQCYHKAFVAYVGMARRLKMRLVQHPVLREFSQYQRFWVRRWFLPTPISELRDKERAHIQEFDPPWNIIGRRKGGGILQ